MSKEEKADSNARDQACQIRGQASQYSMTNFAHANGTKVDGEHVERRLCGAIEHAGEVADVGVWSVGVNIFNQTLLVMTGMVFGP